MKLYKILFCLFLSFFTLSKAAFSQRGKPEKPLEIIHFQLAGSQLMIPVTIDHGNDTLHFLFDSGCEINLLSLPVASRLGLRGATDAGLSGWSNKMTYMPQTQAKALQIGAITIPYPEFYLDGLGGASLDGTPIDGVLGYDLLKRFIIKIDFHTKEMDIYRMGNFRYPPGGKLFMLSMDYDTPTIDASLINNQGQTFTSAYHVVTGGNFGLLLNAQYVGKYSLDHSLTLTGKVIRQDLLQPITYNRYVIPTFRIGDYRFSALRCLYSPMVNDTGQHKEIAGAVGADVWKHFTLIFNLPQKELYLIPEKNNQ